MSTQEKVTCNEQITQIRFDRHTIQFALDGGGIIVAEGILEVSTPGGEFAIDVKCADRNLNVLSDLLDREIRSVSCSNSSAALEIEEGYAARIVPSGRGGEAGLIRIGDCWIVIA
jgi:hypothetical protein